MEIKEAVQVAFNHVRDLYADQKIQDLLLEEVRKKGDLWYVTISFARSSDAPTALKDMFVPTFLRAYRVVELNANTGELVAVGAKEP